MSLVPIPGYCKYSAISDDEGHLSLSKISPGSFRSDEGPASPDPSSARQPQTELRRRIGQNRCVNIIAENDEMNVHILEYNDDGRLTSL